MNEIEELLAQRKEIDRKLRELRSTTEECGRIKLELRKFPRGEEWTVFVKKSAQYPNESRYMSVIQLEDKSEVLLELNNLIDDLIGLREKVRWTT